MLLFSLICWCDGTLIESSMLTELLSSNAEICTNKPWLRLGSRSQRLTADITLRLIDPVSLTFTVSEPASRKIGLRFLCLRPGRTMSYTSILCRTLLTFLIWLRLKVISASLRRSFSGMFEMLKNRRNLLWYLKRLSMLLSVRETIKVGISFWFENKCLSVPCSELI